MDPELQKGIESRKEKFRSVCTVVSTLKVQKIREDRIRMAHLEKTVREYQDLDKTLKDMSKKRKHAVMV
jgi:hypothetical protein